MHRESGLFEILILVGRPAAGKSEIIDYLKKTPVEKRKRGFHIGDFVEFDDFPMLWAWFEEDRILEDMGKQRLHTDQAGYFRYPYLWNLLIRRLELEYDKLLADNPDFMSRGTAILEFSRGSEHGGFREAFRHLSAGLLGKSAVLYIDVGFEESMRKNRRRFNPSRAHSILEHGLPDEKLRRLYEENDWAELSSGDSSYLSIGEIGIPYRVFDNADDVTTRGGEQLGNRLRTSLSFLWTLRTRGLSRGNIPGVSVEGKGEGE
ncbi:MAG TPA: hypothetical protein VMX75_04400 [Spirochaetia bacterium]|nr:hypothetical protein [Spirochaetia bacterium]